MTTLVLQAAGGAVGGLIGGPFGATLGRTLGAAFGSAIDGALFGSQTTRSGPRLATLGGITSTEGAPIPRVYGRVRIGGQVIWATRFLERVADTQSGGKGGLSGGATTRTYSYSANVAIGLCEGPIGFVRRIWADGKLLEWTGLTIRVHRGDEGQMPDPLIVAKEGADNAPAYRGLAYVVFEDFPLGDYGNRVPQFAFEVVRPVSGMREAIQAVNLIPGAGEFAYDPLAVTTTDGTGATTSLNRHDLGHASDFEASLDQLQALCPGLASVSLVVSWFGDDLRAGACTIAPRVEASVKLTPETEWRVNGLSRSLARVVSLVDGAPAYGGTPSDPSVLRAIRALKARGLAVTLYPFAMMDIAQGNMLPDPRVAGATQPAYPWRGRILCGAGSAHADLARFFGQAKPGDFAPAGTTTAYSGSDEWSWRRMILHYATLAAMAGGVDGFVIGSELVGLTGTESAPGVFPAAARLAALAQDVKAVLGASTRVTYGADWTEYGGRVMADGALRFPLDPLWASPAIDAVGIDFYPPVSDWRDGSLHLDAVIARSVYDPAYLRDRIAGGEAFDWYYATDADRAAQIRTLITDGASGKPWVWRAKDLVGWWSNPHVERVGGVESPAPTAWQPMGKPIVFIECGCPAVDRGANGPNVFPDPKSAEDALPPFSRGFRDDLMQARLIGAMFSRFDPAAPGFSESANPVSPVYGGRMINPARISLWAWDARPFPAFPAMAGVWSDAANWQTGHWLNGRLEGLALDRLIAALLADYGLSIDDIAVDGFLDGYAVTDPSSARSALEPLAALYGFDVWASSGRLHARSRDRRLALALGPDDVVPGSDGALLTVTRAQESELPQELRIGFSDGENDYRAASVASRRLAVKTTRQSTSAPAVVTTRAEAQRLADTVLHALWAGREQVRFTLRPGLIELEPGDHVTLPALGQRGIFRITRITDRGVREVEAQSVERFAGEVAAPLGVPAQTTPPALPGRSLVVAVDLPVIRGESVVLQALAAVADPWPGSLTAWRSGDGDSFAAFGTIARPATLGVTLDAFAPGPLWRWDMANALTVRLYAGSLASGGDFDALAAATPLAIKGPDGMWEVFSFARAELVGDRTFRLSRLLRGLGGSEVGALRMVPPGATVVRLDDALLPIATGSDALGATWQWRIVASTRDYLHPTAATLNTLAPGAALLPLAPVNATARRTVDGVWIAFTRRGRIHADPWDPAEIPLGEASERYEADIMSGDRVVRTLASTVPALLYPAAAEQADFGGPQTSLRLRIAQISDAVGRGAALDTVLISS